ncbi:MAG: carboxypeptidase-like regulatory domain-containing protein, partial [Bacteroidota bacterium]|nr:carboxypeptidase-like regulatory domain-containing protein [Bacteroidota bacterium]
MKKIIFGLLFLLTTSFLFGQTGGIQGKVISSDNSPVQNVSVSVLGTNYSAITNEDGEFSVENVATGEYQLLLVAVGFDNVFIDNVKVKDSEITDIGTVTMNLIKSQVDDAGVVEINADDLNNEQGGGNISTLLHGSKDVFLNAAAYTFGPMRFRIRGYDNKYFQVMINGLDMANLETGRTYWSGWGGLNNISKYRTTTSGLDAADATFGNIGGTTDIQMVPSTFQTGLKLTYSMTNRSYRNRVMATYSTGMMPNNWAITVSGSHRWSEEGYVEGTFYDSWAYYLAVEKKLKAHNIVFNVFGSPTRRGKRGASIQESYDLLDNVYYNPYWGYQDGEKRNSRISIGHQPVAILSDYWKINTTTKLNTTIAVRAGRNGSTALTWYNAPDPRPDYYRYLPS